MKQEEKIKIRKGASNFTLVGNIRLNDNSFRIQEESASGYIYNRINLSVDCGNGNVVFCEVMGGHNPMNEYPIYVHGKKPDGMDDYSNSFTIAWEDRFNKDLLYDVGERCFYIARLQKDLDDKLITEKFLSAYDFIEFLYKTLNNGQKVRIDGVLQYTYYNGEIQTRKIINKIQLASDEATLQATYSQMFLINKDSIGKREKEKKRIPVYAYVPEYVSKYDSIPVKETVLMPKDFYIYEDDFASSQAVINMFKKWFKFHDGWFAAITAMGEIKEGVSLASYQLEDLDEDTRFFVETGILTMEEAVSKVISENSSEKIFTFKGPRVVRVGDENTEGLGSIRPDYEEKKYKVDEVTFMKDIVSRFSLNEDNPSPKQSAKNSSNQTKDEPSKNTEDESKIGDIDLDSMFDGLF